MPEMSKICYTGQMGDYVWSSKMKACCLIAFFAVFLILPAAGHAQLAYKLSQRQYHPPQTPAEQALDSVFHLENSADTAQLAGFFTPQLTNAIANADQGRDQESGISYDVLLCGQNNPQIFLYQTISDDGQTALIAYNWPGSSTDISVYRLLNENGKWNIDGINCSGAGAGKFNMQ
jgi:hypothetical protein